MANGHPKIGGTNGVPELDLGQIGGSRQAAGDALFSGQVIFGPDSAATVRHHLPQQNLTFEDNLGYTGGRATIEGVLRCKTAAIYETIIQEVNERLHGSLRDEAGGELQPANLGRIAETQLTRSDGTVLSKRAVLGSWQPRGRTFKNDEWAVIQRITLEITLLG